MILKLHIGSVFFVCKAHTTSIIIFIFTDMRTKSACTKKIEAGRDLFLKSGYNQQEIIKIRVWGGFSHTCYPNLLIMKWIRTDSNI